MRATKRAIDSKTGRPISKASYELWDLTSGNIIGGYGTEAAALEAVRDILQRLGPEMAERLMLGCEERGQSRSIATGAALVRRALPDQAQLSA